MRLCHDPKGGSFDARIRDGWEVKPFVLGCPYLCHAVVCRRGVIEVAVFVRMFCLRGCMVLVGRMKCEGFAPESSAIFLPSPSVYCESEWALYRCSLSSWSSVMVAVLPFANFLLLMRLPCWYRGDRAWCGVGVWVCGCSRVHPFSCIGSIFFFGCGLLSIFCMRRRVWGWLLVGGCRGVCFLVGFAGLSCVRLPLGVIVQGCGFCLRQFRFLSRCLVSACT